MTEEEWLLCDDPITMLCRTGERVSNRRARLVACACCRRLWHKLADGSKRAVELAERYADGRATSDDLWDAYRAADEAVDLAGYANDSVYRLTFPDDQFDELDVIDHAVAIFESESEYPSAEWLTERAAQVQIVHEVLGNPFRRITISASWLDWNDRTVPRIAQAIYEERAFDRLPILADALEDAGCEDAGILSHCRGPAPHVRGCWVIDLILGKQ